MKLNKRIVLAISLATIIAGCGNDSKKNNSTVTVERGAVLEAIVKDANGQIAKMLEKSNKYKFDKEIKYPITVTGGYIDIDGNGEKSDNDVKLTTTLKTDFGDKVTLLTTAISSNDEKEREKKLDKLSNALNIKKEELLKLPSQSYENALVSNEIYLRLKNDTNSKLSDIIENLEANGLKSDIESKKSMIDKKISTQEFAKSMENKYVNKLVENKKIEKISKDEIINELGNKAYKLSIFHVNDTHSHIPSEMMSFYINKEKTYIPVGGYARYVTKINELKKAKSNSLLLNAGDVFQGTLFYSLFKGEADAAAMNLINWDAYALGNHEFDDGDEGLKKFLDLLNTSIPVVSANVVPKAGNILENKWKPYTIKEVGGQKIGIIGIDIVGKTKNSSNPSDEIQFFNETQTAQKYIDELIKKGINKIVLLTHQGYENDITMAQKLNGVDIIVGGDSHSLLGDFSSIGLSSVSNDYPTKVSSKDSKNVCIVQAWEYGHILGDLDIVFNDKGEVVSCSGKPLLLIGDEFMQKDSNKKKVLVDSAKKNSIMKVIDASDNIEVVSEDADTLKVVKKYEDQVDTKKALKIGSSSEKLGHNRFPMDKKDGTSLLPLGSDIAPIVAKSFYDLSNLADACIQNAGGVRVAINEGDITMGDAYTLLPFANTLFEIKMSGEEVKQVLEDALDFAVQADGSTGAFPYAYALKYDVDMTKGVNNRVSNLEIKDRKTNTWSNIDKNKVYTIVTNSYIADGKDGYSTFKTSQEKRGKGVDTYLDYAMSFVRYVEAKTKAGQKVGKLPSEEHPIKSFKK